MRTLRQHTPHHWARMQPLMAVAGGWSSRRVAAPRLQRSLTSGQSIWQVQHLPPVGAPPTSKGAGADEAKLIYSGSAAATCSSGSPAATSAISPGEATTAAAAARLSDGASAAPVPPAASTAGSSTDPPPPADSSVAASGHTAAETEAAYLRKWMVLDMHDEALEQLGRHTNDLPAAESAMLELQSRRGLPRTAQQEARRAVTFCKAIIAHRKDMRAAQARTTHSLGPWAPTHRPNTP